MQLLPLHTGKLNYKANLVGALAHAGTFEDGDIVAISSKVIAYTEGAAIDLSTLEVSAEAERWAQKLNRTNKNPAFRQAVLNETARMNGRVLNGCPFAMLCELEPESLDQGVILAVNAGLDMSNIDEGYAIGWPTDPVHSAKQLRSELQEYTGKTLGIIITDSCCHPRRWGVGAMALTVAGMDPLVDEVGRKDLWGDTLTMTKEAVADQLATAANYLMGNADQAVPGVIIRNSNLPLSEYAGWVPGIQPDEDIFQGLV